MKFNTKILYWHKVGFALLLGIFAGSIFMYFFWAQVEEVTSDRQRTFGSLHEDLDVDFFVEAEYAFTSSGLKYISGTEDSSHKPILAAFNSMIYGTFLEKYVGNLIVYYREDSNILAFVKPRRVLDDTVQYRSLWDDADWRAWYREEWDNSTWDVYINRGLIGNDKVQLLSTIAHEMGHVVSLNSFEIDRFSAGSEGTCKTFLTVYGCVSSTSYIYAFMEEFWIRDDWWTGEEFVSWYAEESPYEDFSETFDAFVRNGRPQGFGTRSAKVNFFYRFDELITLREKMRKAMVEIEKVYY